MSLKNKHGFTPEQPSCPVPPALPTGGGREPWTTSREMEGSTTPASQVTWVTKAVAWISCVRFFPSTESFLPKKPCSETCLEQANVSGFPHWPGRLRARSRHMASQEPRPNLYAGRSWSKGRSHTPGTSIWGRDNSQGVPVSRQYRFTRPHALPRTETRDQD